MKRFTISIANLDNIVYQCEVISISKRKSRILLKRGLVIMLDHECNQGLSGALVLAGSMFYNYNYDTDVAIDELISIKNIIESD